MKLVTAFFLSVFVMTVLGNDADIAQYPLLLNSPVVYSSSDLYWSTVEELTSQEQGHIESTKTEAGKQQYDITKTTIEKFERKVRHKSEAEVKSSLSGFKPPNASMESKTNLSFLNDYEKKLNETEKEEFNKMLEQERIVNARQKVEVATGNYFLHFNLNLINRTKDEYSFTPNRDKPFKVKVRTEQGGTMICPITESIMLPPYESVSVPIVSKITDSEFRKRLEVIKNKYGVEYQDKIFVSIDNVAPLINSSGKPGILRTRETYTKIDISWGEAKKYFPFEIKVLNDTRMPVKLGEGLSEISQFLMANYRDMPRNFFDIQNGALVRIYDQPFGRVFENEEENDGFLIIMRKGMFDYVSVGQKELSEPPFPRIDEVKCITFERLSVKGIARQPDMVGRKVVIELLQQLTNMANDPQCHEWALDSAARIAWYLEKRDDAIGFMSRLHGISSFDMLFGDEMSPIEYACIKNDAQKVDKLLECKCLIDAAKRVKKTKSGFCNAMNYAISNDNVQLVTILDNNGVSLPSNQVMICQACKYGALKIAKSILDGTLHLRSKLHLRSFFFDNGIGHCNSCEEGESALVIAAKKGSIDLCRLLVEAGADYMNETNDSCIDKSIKKDVREYIVALRAVKGVAQDSFTVRGWPKNISAKKVKEWVSAGVYPNSSIGECRRGGSWTLYSWAVVSKKAKLVTWLIEHGANIEDKSRPEPLGQSELHGYTAEMLAVDKGNTNLIVALCKVAKDPAAEKSTMLKYALDKAEKYEVCKFLVNYGADVNVKSKEKGFTPLMWAAKQGDVALVEELIKKGADINAAYKETGKTAICHAIENGKSNVVRMFIPQLKYSNMSTNRPNLDGMNITGGNVWDEQNFYQFAASHLQDEALLRQIFAEEKSHKPYYKNRTPLMAAAHAGNLAAVRILVEKEDVNARDESGNTALDYAKKAKQVDVVKYYSECGYLSLKLNRER